MQSPLPPSEPDPTPETMPRAFSEVFADAASQAIGKIRHDAKAFADDEEATELFEYLEEHLFDADLDVHSWRIGAGVSRKTYDKAVAALGPLKTYADELRIGVAARLVLETDADFVDVGGKVGYEVPRSFRRTFQRVCGQSPRQMRLAHDAHAESGPSGTTGSTKSAGPRPDSGSSPVEPPGDDELSTRVQAARWRRRVALGFCDKRQRKELRRLLRQRYACLRGSPPAPKAPPRSTASGDAPMPDWVKRPVRFLSTHEQLGWKAAWAVISHLLAMPDPEIRHAMVEGIRFSDVSGFELVHRACFEMLNIDPARAVKLADLAVEMAHAHPEDGGGEKSAWRALAWANLGHIRLLAGDGASAEAAFVAARAEWETPRETPQPRVEALVCLREATLRRVRRRYDEAMRLASRAAQLGRDDPALVIDSRVERAEVALLAGDSDLAVAMMRKVLDEWPHSGKSADWEAELRCASLFCLARALVAARDDEEAAVRFAEARALLTEKQVHLKADVDLEEAWLFLLTGRLEKAEELMRASRDGFARVNRARRATATAYLAAVCACRGRYEQARAECAEAMGFFRRMPLHREALRAASLLRRMTETEEEVTTNHLDELRRCLLLVDAEIPFLPWRDRTVSEHGQAEHGQTEHGQTEHGQTEHGQTEHTEASEP